MSLVIALLNDGTTTTLGRSCLPSMALDSWDLAEIFAFAVAYGLYLTLAPRCPAWLLHHCRVRGLTNTRAISDGWIGIV